MCTTSMNCFLDKRGKVVLSRPLDLIGRVWIPEERARDTHPLPNMLKIICPFFLSFILRFFQAQVLTFRPGIMRKPAGRVTAMWVRECMGKSCLISFSSLTRVMEKAGAREERKDADPQNNHEHRDGVFPIPKQIAHEFLSLFSFGGTVVSFSLRRRDTASRIFLSLSFSFPFPSRGRVLTFFLWKYVA